MCPWFTKPLKDGIRENAERIAIEAGVEIEFIRKQKSFREEDRIQEILKNRGDHPGLVHVFSAMERCNSYKPWHDQQLFQAVARGEHHTSGFTNRSLRTALTQKTPQMS